MQHLSGIQLKVFSRFLQNDRVHFCYRNGNLGWSELGEQWLGWTEILQISAFANNCAHLQVRYQLAY